MFVWDKRDVRKIQRWKAYFNFTLKATFFPSCFKFFLHGWGYYITLSDPWYETLIVIDVFYNLKEILLRERENFASFKFYWFLFDNAP
jgi:hypothetical protein